MVDLGLQPFGTAGPFGGPGLISVLDVSAIGLREIVVSFDAVPETDNPNSRTSATNIQNYTVTPVDPRIPSTTLPDTFYLPPGSPAVPTRGADVATAEPDPVDPRQIILSTEQRLEQRVEYIVAIVRPIRGSSCQTLSGPTSFEVFGVVPGPLPVPIFIQEDRFRDFENVLQLNSSEPLSAFTITDAGDIALHDEVASLRKRIERRIFTEPGEFSFLPNYGFNPGLKNLVRTGDIQRIVTDAQAQVSAEPDVEAASVTATVTRTGSGAIVEMIVSVRRRAQRDARFLFVLRENPAS